MNPSMTHDMSTFWKRFDDLVHSLELPVARPTPQPDSTSSQINIPIIQSYSQSSSSSSSSNESQSQPQSFIVSQSPIQATQFDRNDCGSFDDYSQSPQPNPSASPFSNKNDHNNNKRRFTTGTAEMEVAKKRFKEMGGPLHVTPSPNEAPPLGSNGKNYLRHVLIHFADKIVNNNLVNSDVNNLSKPSPQHFGIGERYIRAKLKQQNKTT